MSSTPTHSEVDGASLQVPAKYAAAAAADAHIHQHHGGGDHVPHVLPLSAYLATWFLLIVLTVATVIASYFNFGAGNFIIAILIATTKACVVAAMFMHLRYDRKFHAIIFSFSIIFLGIFILFTMYDTETRGKTDFVEHDRPVDVSMPFKEGKDEASMKRRYEGNAPAEPTPAPATPAAPAKPLAPPQN